MDLRQVNSGAVFGATLDRFRSDRVDRRAGSTGPGYGLGVGGGEAWRDRRPKYQAEGHDHEAIDASARKIVAVVRTGASVKAGATD